MKAAAARCLKNVCQHGVGKIAAFEMGAAVAAHPAAPLAGHGRAAPSHRGAALPHRGYRV